MKQILTSCAAAGVLLLGTPAFADTVYDPSTGQSFVTTPSNSYIGGSGGYVNVSPSAVVATSATAGPTPGYVNAQGSWGGPLEVITAPFRTLGVMMQPVSGAIGGYAGANLVPVNRSCGVQTDFNGKHTAMCGP